MGNVQLTAGSRIAQRFEIEGVAGRGGMGTVYRARDTHGDRPVAIKLLHEGAGAEEETKRFLREAELLSELRHPNIVAYVAHGQTENGQRFLAMEWLEGEDLGQRLLRGPLTIAESVTLLERLAEALSATHRRGVLHRDLKPTNVFLVGGEVAQPKILDFGIARRISASHSMTRAGSVIGTPAYMAPEQARGVRELTPAADFFSLGCILYECLTGQPPFLADHIAAVLVRILFEEPLPIEERRAGIPLPLRVLIRRLLAKEPNRRLADLATLHVALAACEEGPEFAATMASTAPRLTGFGENEQSLLSVVLAAPPDEGLGTDLTLRPSDVLQRQEREDLMSSLQRMSVSADFLAVGALVVTVSPTGSAIDQVTRAAHAAMHIKERWPAAVVVIATGRGAMQGRTTVGEVVDAAARVLRSGSQPAAASAAGEILLDALSARLLDGRFPLQAREGGGVLLSAPQELDASRPLLGKPTPCVGRDSELSSLEAQLTGCIEESEPRVVLVTAPPGVGKSRLRHEFVNRMAQRHATATVLVGRGDLTNAGSPYGILGQAVRRLCGIFGSEPVELQRERLQARIGQHLDEEARQRVTLFLGELSGVHFSDEAQPMLSSARQDPRILCDCVRQAFVDWLRAECQVAPMLIVLDDLQWGDGLSVGLLDDGLRQLPEAPLFILALGRPELRETFLKLWQVHHPQELPLKALSKKACERFVLHMLGKQTAADLARIIEQSAGNALFLEELIRSQADRESEAPFDTVLAMLQARIGRLSVGPRRALLAASVFGRTFWLGGVAQILELSAAPIEVEGWLQALCSAELIEQNRSSQFTDQHEYTFRHALVCDAAYALLTDQDRSTGHRVAARFLEAAGERDAANIASHHQRGGEAALAAIYFSRAAEYALERYDLAAAIQLAEQSFTCNPDDDVQARLLAIECTASAFMGRLVRAFLVGKKALPALRAGSLSWARALFGFMMSTVFGPPECQSELPALTEHALSTDPEREAEKVYAELLHSLVQGMSTAIPPAQVQPILQRIEEICRRATAYNPALWRYHQGAMARLSYHCAPTPYTTLQEAEEAERSCLQAGDLRTGGFVAAFVLAPSLLSLGGLERAEKLLSTYWDLACTTREFLLQRAIQTKRAELYLLRGDPRDYGQVATYANETIEQMSMIPAAVGESYNLLAHLHLRQGNPSAAEDAARRACSCLTPLPNYIPNIHATLISSLISQNKIDDSLIEAQKALQILGTFGCVGHAEVELRLTISEAFLAADDRERANLELRETLRQVQLRASDITDPFLKNSYLTWNPYCVRAQQLAAQLGVTVD